jgi:hypothetical protein
MAPMNETAATPTTSIKHELHRKLQISRAAMLSKLDGLSEYDLRRPMTPTGTNLLGLVKHLSGVELGYLGACVGRPTPVALPWEDDGSVWESADMWATPEQSRDYLLDLYRTAWRHSDQSLATLPLDAPASVAWWPEDRRATTFGSLVVRVVAETAQHAGHCGPDEGPCDAKSRRNRYRPECSGDDGAFQADVDHSAALDDGLA